MFERCSELLKWEEVSRNEIVTLDYSLKVYLIKISFCLLGILQKLYDYTRCPLAAPIYGGFPVKMR
jgi:hypothetical protein